MRFVSPIQPGGPGRGSALRLMAAACTAGVMAFAAADASAAIVKNTNQAGAADAEVREEESSGTGQRGNNAELATRRGGTQNSVMLLRFNISDLTPQDLVDNPTVVIRLHANTASWTPARSNDVPSDPGTGNQFGLSYHALNLNAPNQTWSEDTVSFTTAPGLTYDGDVATKGYNADTTHLGDRDFLPIHTSNILEVGYAWDFSSPGLTNFVSNALTQGADEITFLVGINEGSAGFNYVFAGNDTTALRDQTNWNPDARATRPHPSPGPAMPTGNFHPS